jgi:sugar phosphate isomerase/epimerase
MGAESNEETMTDRRTRRMLSTYLWISHKLAPATLDEIERAEMDSVEIFCAKGHFDYTNSDIVREFGTWFASHKMKLHSLHAPTSRDFSPGREGGSPVSISDLERLRRLDAVDEIKRALEVAERIPFDVMILHAGGSRDEADPRRWDAAFSSLENLTIFARQRGVTLALENTPGELATPENLKNFVEQTRLPGLKLCFDSGHAQLATVNGSESLDGNGAEAALEIMRGLAVTCHLHDNHGEKDEHLLPYGGTINWENLMKALPAELPILLELREQSAAPQMPSFDAIRTAFDALEKARDNS